MRQISMRSRVAERKLQHRHSRDVMTIAQRNHIWSNKAEVFGEERQSAEFIAHLIEKFISWPIHPAAVNRSRFVGRNLPELRETTKVVEPDEIASLRGPAQALYPPMVLSGANCVPVVQRIAPALSGGAEVIGRHTGHDFRLQIVFQTK